jgi:hypothetical protein
MNQCVLEKPLENGGVLRRISWIPSKFASIGRVLKLRDDRGEWLDGFHVKFVSAESMPVSLIQHRSRDYTRQRRASDI